MAKKNKNSHIETDTTCPTTPKSALKSRKRKRSEEKVRPAETVRDARAAFACSAPLPLSAHDKLMNYPRVNRTKL